MNRQQQKLLRGLVIAAVVLLAVLAAVLLFKRHSAEKQAEEEAAQEAASAITEDHGYTSLTYTNSTATLSFTQDEDGSWIWADDPEFPLDDSTITYIIQILQSLKRLVSLEGNLRVCPGHESTTSLDAERSGNPFVRDALR